MQLQCLCANLMICSLKFKNVVFLENVDWDFVLLLLVLKLYPIQVVISLPLWIKLIMDQLLLFYLWNFSSFFSLRQRCPRNQPFSQFVIDRYILAIQQIITHKERLRYTFWSVETSWTASDTMAPRPLHRKWLKQTQSHFH